MDKSEKYNHNRLNEFLPVKLIQKLNDDIINDKTSDYRTNNNFLRCVGIIYHHQIHKSYGLDGYVALGSSYWKKIFSRDYYIKVINPLLELNIIKRKDFGYRNSGLVGIRYRVNPELTDCECNIISYTQKGISNTQKEVDDEFQEFDELNAIPDKNFLVGIYTERALAWIEENMEKTCNKLLKLDYSDLFSDNKKIKYIEYIDGGTYNTSYGTIKSCKKHAHIIGKELFFFDDTFYIGDVDQFLSKRIELMKYFYKREISKVGVYPPKYNRSNTNLRVHNYLTNFPSSILQYITINSKTVVQLDLKTSQFLLFANLLNVYILKGEKGLLSLFKQKKNKIYLKKLIEILKQYQHQLPSVGVDINYPKSSENSTHDVTKFIRDVFFNDFYVVVKNILGLSERSLAKDEVFKLLFKKDSKQDDELTKLTKHYKVVMAIISEFKKIMPLETTTIAKSKQTDLKTNLRDVKTEKATKTLSDELIKQNELSNNFSVFLQCIEAEIFIDNILLPLRKQGVPCFTRHDSIVVANGYEDQVETFIKNVFEKFGFKYNHKFEDMWWEVFTYQEMEDSGMWDQDSDEDLKDLVMQYEDSYATTIEYQELTEFPTSKLTSFDEIQNLNSTLKNSETISIIDQHCNLEEPEDESEPEDDDMEDENDYLEDEDIEILERLEEIGIHEDYFDFIDPDFIVEILQLSILTDRQAGFLEVEIRNIQDGMSHFQKEANDVLMYLINYWNNYKKSMDG